jgi:hypothetical protein
MKTTVDAEIAVPLEPLETDRLSICEKVIEHGLATFVEVGDALLTIRDNRLYRGEYATFDAYCKERWGFSRQRAHQLTDAAEVVGIVSTIVDVPPGNEAQARELVPLKDEPEAMAKVWVEVLEETDGKPTAAAVHKVVAERTADVGQVDSTTPEELQQHLAAGYRHIVSAAKHMGHITGQYADEPRFGRPMTRAVLAGLPLEKWSETLSECHGLSGSLCRLVEDARHPSCDAPGHRGRRADIRVEREVIDGIAYDVARCPECRKERDGGGVVAAPTTLPPPGSEGEG